MKKQLLAVFAVSLIAIAGFGQGHGPGGPPMAGMGPGGDHDGGGPGGLLVATDGTVFVVNQTAGATAGTGTTVITAIRSTGGTAWTVTLPTVHNRLEISGSNLLAVTDTKNADGTFTSTITAIAAASGATAWTQTFSGHVGQLTPFSGGTYAVVVVPAATTGGTAARSLVAISSTGSILWTVALP